MSSTSTSRVALVLSLASLGVTLYTLLDGDGETRPSSKAAAPESRAWADEAERRDEALADEIQALREELASLPAPEVRRALEPEAAESSEDDGEDDGDSESVATPAERAADDPGEFQLRRELLEGFDELDADDRRAALGRLAELARWGDDEAKALIAASLQDSSAGVRARALKEMLELDKANLPEYLRGSLADPSHKVRAVVASRLDKLPEEEAGPLLVGLLKDPEPDVVLEAIESLDELDYADAAPALVEQLQSQSLDVATRSAQALMKLGDDSATPRMIERILVDFAKDDVSGRVNNVKRLRRLRAVGSLETIYASDPSLAVREEAREALASIED